MTRRRLAVVTAGLRRPSSTRLLADRIVAAVRTELGAAGADPDVEVIELREHAREIATSLLSGFPAGELRSAVDTVVGADGVVAVTPIFTGSYSGLFKSFFDAFEAESLAGVPVLIGATGGTPRHSLALEHAIRPMFTYLRAVVAPTAVYAAPEDWGASENPDGRLGERIERAARELARLVADEDRVRAPDPYENPTPFEELLSAQGAG